MPPAGFPGHVALALGRAVADMGDRLTDITVRGYFARLGVEFGASLTQNAPVRVARTACETAAGEVRDALAEFAAADSDATAWAKLALMLDAIASAKEPLEGLSQALVAEKAH